MTATAADTKTRRVVSWNEIDFFPGSYAVRVNGQHVGCFDAANGEAAVEQALEYLNDSRRW